MDEISEVVAHAIEAWFFSHDRKRAMKRLNPDGPYSQVDELHRGFDMAMRNIMLRLASEDCASRAHDLSPSIKLGGDRHG